VTVLKPTDLESDLSGVLERATQAPQDVMSKGQLLVIAKAELVSAPENQSLSPWELRAKAIESFYDPAKTW
jgi:hypothetical protein